MTRPIRLSDVDNDDEARKIAEMNVRRLYNFRPEEAGKPTDPVA